MVNPIIDTTRLRTEIHDYIVTNFLFDTTDVADDASLIAEGVLDSTGVLEMVLFVEEQLGVPVSDEEVLPENFDSINALVQFVKTKLDADVRRPLTGA